MKKARGVNALELRIAFLAFPVGAGDVHELERGDALGGRDMRAAAEVEEFAGAVKRDHQLVGFFFDEFTLEDLVVFLVELEGFGLGNELAFIGQVLRSKLVHLFFDFREIFRSERLVAQKFVEKASVDGRADAELDVGIKLHHSGGEQMRRGMTKDEERVGILFGEDLQLDVFLERAAQIHQFTEIGGVRQRSSVGRGDAGDQRGICQPWGNFARDIRRSRALGHLLNLAIRQCDLHLLHDSLTWKEKH